MMASLTSTAFRPQGSDRIDPMLVVLWVGLIAIALLWFAPIVFILFTSLKTNADVMNTGAFTPPPELFFQNYPDAWQRGSFGTRFMKKNVPVTPFGQRFMTIGRSRRCGSRTSATSA